MREIGGTCWFKMHREEFKKCYGIEDWIKDTLANIRVQIIFGLDTCPPTGLNACPRSHGIEHASTVST